MSIEEEKTHVEEIAIEEVPTEDADVEKALMETETVEEVPEDDVTAKTSQVEETVEEVAPIPIEEKKRCRGTDRYKDC